MGASLPIQLDYRVYALREGEAVLADEPCVIQRRRVRNESARNAVSAGSQQNRRKPLRRMVPKGGVEPPTLRFSVACSTS